MLWRCDAESDLPSCISVSQCERLWGPIVSREMDFFKVQEVVAQLKLLDKAVRVLPLNVVACCVGPVACRPLFLRGVTGPSYVV
jgi:hypothetical protein